MKHLLLAASVLLTTSFSFAQAAEFEVTDVLCQSGAEVNLRETLSPGFDFEWQQTNPTSSELEAQIKNPKVSSLLKEDKAKQIIFAESMTEPSNAYASGSGPCPKDDLLVLIAKPTK